MSFVSAALVVLRESFEAFLIVGILLGLVAKLGAPQHRLRIFAGTAAGVVTSLLVGFLLLTLAENLREDSEVVFEAVASLLAAAVLTYMIVWMYRHTQDLMGGMHARVKAALESGALGALFFIPFIAVVREGFETVLFLAAGPDAPQGLELWGALAAGIAGAALLGWLLFSGIVRLSVERFFAITGVLLVLFAAWILRHGLHELGEVVEGMGGAWHEPGEILAGIGSYVLAGIYLAAMLVWYLGPLLRRKPVAAPAT
ncbi:MAG TPA: FTR1 family protein [Candidatus Thermoplasmatota archaeon]|nr:FTR1 family protein [Candidatus Thermoplasmatota archaeon]